MATSKRRWHQFSLLALLLLITGISVPLGWLAFERNKVQRRHAAITAIGLAILVAYFRNRGSIAVEDINLMKG